MFSYKTLEGLLIKWRVWKSYCKTEMISPLHNALKRPVQRSAPLRWTDRIPLIKRSRDDTLRCLAPQPATVDGGFLLGVR